MAYQQHQINPFPNPMMFPQPQQAQMELLQPQMCLSQQQIIAVSKNNLTFTSAYSVFSHVNSTSSTSQSSIPTSSVTLQPTTVHTPVTTIQSDSYDEQKQNSGIYNFALKTDFLMNFGISKYLKAFVL